MNNILISLIGVGKMRLVKPQKLIYDMEKYAGGSISIVCGSMLIQTNKSIDEMKKAVNELYRLNDALRIRISEDDGQPYQYITEYTEQDIEVLFFTNKEELDNYASVYAKEPLDLNGSLCDLKIVILQNKAGLLAKLHHLISDAWTLALMGTQYNQLLKGEDVKAYSYLDYISSEDEYFSSKRYEKNKEYFLSQFKRCNEVTYISEKQAHTFKAKRATFVIDNENASKIIRYTKEKEVSVFSLFVSAVATYINRVKMSADKFYIGTGVLNRSGAKEQNTMGMFINTAPILIELNNEVSFAENLDMVETSLFSVLRHQKYNYSDLLEELKNNYKFNEKLYDIMLSYQNAKVLGDEVETTWYHSGMQTESLQFHVDDRDSEGIFRIHYDYLTEKFTENEIKKMHEHICNLLFSAIEDDSKKLYELNILSDDEIHKVFCEFNDTVMDYPRDKCVHQLFEKQVEKTPDKIAIVACDKTLTYAELNQQANQIANSLINKGIQQNDIIAFQVTRKSHLIALMLGILKAGASYMPIDPNYPQDRVDYMVNDSGAKLCVKDEMIQELLCCDNTDNPLVYNSPEERFCILHTSGSTGMPKGAAIKHMNMVNFIYSNQYLLNGIENIIAINTVTFDVFEMDTIFALVSGITCVLASEEQQFNQTRFEQMMDQYKNCLFWATPTKITNYINNSETGDFFKHINCYVVGGEILKPELLDKIRELNPDISIYTVYGPTETLIYSTLVDVSKTNDISIGHPIANTQIYIVDKYLQPTPIGVVGELCIAGDGVGEGYINRPELTKEKFINNPFGEGKLYKTGDLTYWREDGNIAYVGRNDFQVKIRGLRIELGEIEKAICSIDGISQAVVVVRKSNEGRQLICAFYTGTETDAKDIRKHIEKKLPKYMLPHICVHLDKMPLTASGKINRKDLPSVCKNIISDNEYVEPVTPIQKDLCNLIELILGTTPVGITDDFFDLGGDSLKAIEFVAKSHSEGIYFQLQNLFDYPTVIELCEHLESDDKQVVSFADIDFTDINSILEKNKIENISPNKKTGVGNILLAGATGYLGIHILADFLVNDDGIACCLVRGKNQEDSEKRFNELLNFYFGNKYSNTNRIEVICADLQKERFALSDSKYEELLSKINTVINCAASVKHYGSYKYFYETNVETTKRLIEFCKSTDIKLIHASTLSVSGNSFVDAFDGYTSKKEKHFYENNLYIEQPLDNVYCRSKFEAEKAVLDAMTDGLKANIMRMGNLTSRLSDGQFQKNYESNAFLQRVKSILELGVFPEYLIKDTMYAEFTPIDEAANAVMTIARHFSTEQTVFHINSTKVVHFDKLFDILNNLNIKVNIVDRETFTETLRKTTKQAGMEHIFETFINDMDDNDQLNYDSNIRIKNEFTVEYLRQLGFEWSDIDVDYLHNYIEYFKKIGYLR